MSEQALKLSIVQALERLPDVRVLRMNAGKVKVRGGWMQLSEDGTPDLLVLLPLGRCIWLETKAPKGRMREAQEKWHAAARKLGHDVHEVRDVVGATSVVFDALLKARAA